MMENDVQDFPDCEEPNADILQNGVKHSDADESSVKANGDSQSGKGPKQGQGKFVAQIKKNLTSKNHTSEDNKQTTGSKSSSGSVFSRLSEPTISSANKAVKTDIKSTGGKAVSSKSAVNGKTGSTSKSSSKENLTGKKASVTEKVQHTDDCTRPSTQKSDEKKSKSLPSVSSVENGSCNPLVVDINTPSSQSEENRPEVYVSVCPPKSDKVLYNTVYSSESIPADTVNSSNPIAFNTLNSSDSHPAQVFPPAEVEVASESFSPLGHPGGNNPEISLKDIFFRSTSNSNDMATADPQVENPGEQAPTMEFIIISNGKVKYINTNYKKTGHKMFDYKCDIKLKVADENFKAHREVLSDASDYFSAMFTHNMKEKEQDVIELKDISPKGFSAILDYFYHGHVTIEPENVEGVIEAARFFHVDWLLEICCDFLIRHLSIENYADVIQLQDKYWLGDLRWDIFRFLGQNLADLSQQENFVENLSYELLLEFLMENVYSEPPEYFLLDLIIKWYRSDVAARKENLLSLLRQIRFPVMELEELEALPEEVLQYQELKEAVEEAKNYSLNLTGQCLKNGEMYQQRGARSVITVLSFTNDSNILIYRDPTKSGLYVEELGPAGLDTASYQAMGQARIGNFLYAAGGYDDQYCSVARVFRFDPKYREWTEVAPMNQSRVSFAMCSSDNRLFVVGGVNHVIDEDGNESEEHLNSVEMYNPEDNSWRNLQDIPVKASIQAVAFANGCLYVTGGVSADPNDPVPLNSTWCLNIDGTEGWVPKQNMSNGRHGHSLTLYNNKLYAVGGFTVNEDRITYKDQVSNEVFDLETEQWTDLAPTPERFGHIYPYCEVLYDQLFVIGGIYINANLYTYDPESDNWEEVDVIAPNVQKLAALNVAYPYT